VFDHPDNVDIEALQTYFLRFAEKISEGLEFAGFPACKGGMMARNPRWCRPLAKWREHFSRWIGLAEPNNLLEFNTFFDFRCVMGEAGLASSLRRHVRRELEVTPAFLGHMTRESLQYKPPLGFFGNLVTHGQGTLNVKDAIAPIVNFARLYALRHGISEASTFDRLRRLQELGELSLSSYEDIAQAYDFLMGLRLRHQTDRLSTGLPADNELDLKTLTHLEESSLKQVFSQIALIQKKASFDFLGMA
jgi:CBS domain-containing protein